MDKKILRTAKTTPKLARMIRALEKASEIAGGNMADLTRLSGEMMVVVREEGRMG